MKLDQLKVLQAVVETGSVKAAAEKLNKTQPAISLAVKALEAQMNTDLFDRTGYRLELTSIGKRVYLQSLRVTTEVDDLSQLIEHFEQSNEEQITIAVDAMCDISVLAPRLQSLQTDYPETRVIIRTEILSGAVVSVQSGTADIGIAPIHLTTLEEKEFDYIPLKQIELVNVAAPRACNSPTDIKNIKDLRKFHQILISDSVTPQGEFDRDFGVQKGQRVWYVSDLKMKKELLLAGLGWGRLPRHLIENELCADRLREIPLNFTRYPVELNLYAFRSSALSIGPVALSLWECLAKM
ncbi:LysR family transcriptional regulator [uncultured Microbulbifer sp.]|uniref:LysR family transcriptional regulator n=1 Tax=uncultured Microbulbifer sp. TaxID=348147 RepID=UPI00262EED1E|nr:LysR family transcriptional regulator [uncultured Microbulbifer sp.]